MLDFEQPFDNDYNITECMHKEVGREEWDRAARGGLYLPIGLFGVAMSPRNASHKG